MGLLQTLNDAAKAADAASSAVSGRNIFLRLIDGGVQIIGRQDDAEIAIIADWEEVVSATINTLIEKVEMAALGLNRAFRDRNLLLQSED